ncbi:NAD(P)-dependent oxidoreductase [Streptomyces sp. RB6PN25]|uniref:NAD(P)-dependent oxidoreductase n=1 Tax=Streptomyces humicola TaxID=2953240 RepID=A0ABT1PWM6_9ACTN|nr:NAD(P)-dependent oxidoreductase [Streptomyces humicola]MCQ4082078.1 NAD(P)-dependent oxidoreductase [Streptomyces humicola]
MADRISVAVLGTGTMGAPIARNLARAGHDVRAWNRTRSRAEPLAADGVRIADDPAEAVRGADAVVTMLFDAESVLRAVRAAADGLREGMVWAQTSTVGPEALPRLADVAAEHGLLFIDAPVLGTKAPAENAQLQILAAGPQDARPVADQVFDAIGSRTVWLGEDGAAGAASRLKLVFNSWVLTVINGTTEALALAHGLGVDPQHFLTALEGTALDSAYLRMKADAVLTGNYDVNFTVAGGLKDARLISEAAEQAGVHLDLVPAGAERLARAESMGYGDKDAAASYFASFDKP